jgi:hypothetical protein
MRTASCRANEFPDAKKARAGDRGRGSNAQGTDLDNLGYKAVAETRLVSMNDWELEDWSAPSARVFC